MIRATSPQAHSAIRSELEEALASAGFDPIECLSRQIAAAKRKGDRTEVVEGQKRFLESTPKAKHNQRRTRAKAQACARRRTLRLGANAQSRIRGPNADPDKSNAGKRTRWADDLSDRCRKRLPQSRFDETI
jgi:hypothetical protein